MRGLEGFIAFSGEQAPPTCVMESLMSPRTTVPAAAGVLFTCLAAAGAAAGAPLPSVAFGSRHAAVLRTNGDVLTWGDNVGCQLGRPSKGNSSATPALVMRNGREIAAASDHTLVLTADGRVYGWGTNGDGVLGTTGNDSCEGPALVNGLDGERVVRIATGYGFSVAVTATGDLYCTGDNTMGQCPAMLPRAFKVERFTRVPFPELAGNVAAVRTGLFHTLVLTKDGQLYAFGRANDGQLGGGRGAKGLVRIPGMTGVKAFGAGTWHSVAMRADGTVWTWGNGAFAQLCDGSTANRAEPGQVTLPAGLTPVAVAVGGHSTFIRGVDGRVLACGDNREGQLGIGSEAASATLAPVPAGAAQRLVMGGAHAAFSADGCSVRLAGSTGSGVVPGPSSRMRSFVPMTGLSFCAAPADAPLPNVVREAPKGGVSGCWTSRKEEDASTKPAFATLRQAMLAAEGLLRGNAAFMAATEPVRYRTSLSAGPFEESGARMHVKAVAERKQDGSRVWAGTTGCEVIPQVDRIGGAIAQVSVFFNTNGPFVNESGVPPVRTGELGGYPEYNGWVLITKNGRLPWLPRTVDDTLTAEAERRRRALEEWNHSRAGMKAPDPAWVQQTYEMLKKTDPAGAEKFVVSMKDMTAELHARHGEFARQTTTLEQAVAEVARYRATFSAAQLAAPAVYVDPAIHVLQITNIRPGEASKAIRVKADPAFPGPKTSGGIELIALMIAPEPDPAKLDRKAWRERVRQTFDVAAVAALLKETPRR